MERPIEGQNIVVQYLDQLKTETDPIKRDILERLLIQEVDRRTRHYIMPAAKRMKRLVISYLGR